MIPKIEKDKLWIGSDYINVADARAILDKISIMGIYPVSGKVTVYTSGYGALWAERLSTWVAGRKIGAQVGCTGFTMEEIEEVKEALIGPKPKPVVCYYYTS